MNPSPKEWPADKVERRSVSSLIPYARNSRTHSEEQVTQIAASIKEWGFTTPILVSDDGTIIAGHGRLLAAKKVGLVDVPVMVARGWSEAQVRAYVIADNQLAMNAGWDIEMLKIEIGDLRAEGFDIALTGFGEAELGAMFADEEEEGEGDGAGDGEPSGAGSLAERFGVPPFSVLNAREGWWQDRKRAWLALGIRSELGRGEAA